MERRIEACSTPIKQQHSIKENGKMFFVKNPQKKKARCVRIDDCLFKGEAEKCDYMYEIFVNNYVDIVFYIELKGKQFSTGIKQLKSSINLLKNVHKNVRIKKAYYIGAGIPSITSGTQRAKNEFLAKYNVYFIARTNSHYETI
jgi:hypothetical protein